MITINTSVKKKLEQRFGTTVVVISTVQLIRNLCRLYHERRFSRIGGFIYFMMDGYRINTSLTIESQNRQLRQAKVRPKITLVLQGADTRFSLQ